MTDYSPNDSEDEVQKVIDALLADEAFMESLDQLIDEAEQSQAQVEATMQEQENAPGGGLWHSWLRWLGIEVRTYERETP
ncbi:MAG: hypothetical protein HOC74_16920 [Gemmatimonadetes bacterium]|nr:hypothetical protein [Gemmatimonadota bacterium]MBT7912562.1 hypothetical protein [Candidatus Bathyarchaeota archaeon]